MCPQKVSPEIELEVIRIYTTPAADGTWIGSVTIARSLGITGTTVQSIVRRNGLQVRSAVESHSRGKRCKPVVNLPPEGEKPPLCKCGCGKQVIWNQRKNRWNIYVEGHYRKDLPYKDPEWLRREYESGRTLKDIGDECGVNQTTVIKFMRKYNIPIRPQPVSLALSGAVRGERNPAWKGGVSKWQYAYDWKRVMRIVRKRDNYTCQICRVQFPKTSKILHVHHMDGNKLNNALTNLVTVCASCHPKGKRKENGHL